MATLAPQHPRRSMAGAAALLLDAPGQKPMGRGGGVRRHRGCAAGAAKELTGASFTISSQGNLGGTYFTPLVNWPQVAILGVSESSIQPRWNETKGEFEPRLMLPLSLSYDHRVINGADAAVFTRYIAKLLADPRRVLL